MDAKYIIGAFVVLLGLWIYERTKRKTVEALLNKYKIDEEIRSINVEIEENRKAMVEEEKKREDN